MAVFKYLMVYSVLLLAGRMTALAFDSTEADTIFTAYNTAFYKTNSSANNYYKVDNGSGTGPGWWTFAEEIEMAEDNYDRTGSSAARNVVTALCNGFITQNGTLWTGNNFNDDISWAAIAFARAYQVTGNTNFRNLAKINFDAMYSRAWDTTFTGGGLWWNTSKGSKNACISGPAAVAACYLYSIYGDSSYLSKAQDCYAWERRVLVQTNSGAIYDSISTTSGYNTWASTYNQGTFIGAANFLYRATGLPFYYQDAILAAKYTQNSLSSAGILPVYNSGDLGGFNGILARWLGRMAKDQNLWFAYGPWLNTNASAAWNVRNPNNLSWYNWKAPTPAGTNVLDSWDCSDTVVIMQVALTNAPDMLQITPEVGFTAVVQSSILPDLMSMNLVLTNTGFTSFDWTLANTSAWLNVSANAGTLEAGSPATNLLVSLIPSATTNLSAGRYYTSIWLTNLASGAIQSRSFTLVVSTGNIPIAVTGYNAEILAANTATAGKPGATAIDIPNNYCLYQAGLNGSNRGLPPDGVFTSQLDAMTVFQFQPYGTTNALAVGYNYPNSATLSLAAPQAYNSIAILACSANANGGLGTFVLNFTNGTHSQSFNFNAPDWFNTTANLAIQGIGRLKLGASFGAEDNGASYPNLYQTTLNLAALGLNQSIASITFTKPVNAGAQQISSIFAVSGIPAYREPVITQQPAPANLFRFAGATNSWAVAVNAGFPVFFNWCFNGAIITAATNSNYQLANLQTDQSGNYTVVISNAFGVVTSSIVSLTVVPVPAYPFGRAVLADGALDYWRLDETNGIFAHDYISGNNGIYTPKTLLGQLGDKLLDTHAVARFGYLATSNSCVTNVPVDFGTSGSATFTVEAWVNGGSQSSDAGLVTKGYGAGGEQFNLDCGGSGHAFRFFVRDASGNVHLATSSVVPNNQWHHLVGVCDEVNGYVCLYVDGVNVSQTTITPASGILSSSSSMSIGSRQSGAATGYDSQFIGYMEEVAIYGYALSSSKVQTHFQAVKNRPPMFINNPFSVAYANAGQSYSTTLAPFAGDPNGDTIAFAKVSGPAWLSVGSNGSLGGTPISTDAGTNYFTVSASDPGGLSSAATMTVVVVPAPPISVSAALQGNVLLLNWVGGIAPYQVQWTTNLLNPIWQDLDAPISSNNLLVSPTNEAAFYRVYGQ